jgi:hypothetical protein
MAVRITNIRLSGGTSHEHIVHCWWTNPGTGESGDHTRAEIVRWIEVDKGHAYVEQIAGQRATVGVVDPRVGAKYLRTYADGHWNNNLLALPHK